MADDADTEAVALPCRGCGRFTCRCAGDAAGELAGRRAAWTVAVASNA